MVSEKAKCMCGLDKVESKGVYMCPSEDGIQPQEREINPITREPFRRVKSSWDFAHEAHHAANVKKWFTGKAAE